MRTSPFLPLSNKNYRDWAPLFLRLAMGAGFLVHGIAKFQRGPDNFAKLLSLTGMPLPHFSAWLVTIFEIFGGIALLIGFWVSAFAAPLAIIMFVAMAIIHVHYGFSSIKTIGINAQGPLFGPPGYEINLVYIAGLVSLIITGAGTLSIDSLLGKRNGNFVSDNES